MKIAFPHPTSFRSSRPVLDSSLSSRFPTWGGAVIHLTEHLESPPLELSTSRPLGCLGRRRLEMYRTVDDGTGAQWMKQSATALLPKPLHGLELCMAGHCSGRVNVNANVNVNENEWSCCGAAVCYVVLCKQTTTLRAPHVITVPQHLDRPAGLLEQPCATSRTHGNNERRSYGDLMFADPDTAFVPYTVGKTTIRWMGSHMNAAASRTESGSEHASECARPGCSHGGRRVVATATWQQNVADPPTGPAFDLRNRARARARAS